jgi:hypothetical protein
MLYGSDPVRLTPTEETRTKRAILGDCSPTAASRLRTAVLSVASGPLPPSQRLEGKAVVPVAHTTASMPSHAPLARSAAPSRRSTAVTASAPLPCAASVPAKTARPRSALRTSARTV